MAFLLPFCTIIYLFPISLSSPFGPKLAQSEKVPIPSFAFGWADQKDTFMAGDVATIKVIVLGNYERDKYKYGFDPNVTVNGKMGNSSLLSGLSSNFDKDPSVWRISFIPIRFGLFNVLVTDDNFNVLDSSLHFRVTAGKFYPTACLVSWMGQMNEFVAGTKATVVIPPEDAFGNNVSLASQVQSTFNFTVSATYVNGSVATVLNVTDIGWHENGYLRIEFIVASAGDLLLFVKDKNQSLNGSPLPFKVNPGALDVSNCEANWITETSSFQLFSKMEAFVHQRDQYGNLVPGLYQFDVEVIEKGTNLFMPVADLSSKEVAPGIQLFSFSLQEPGSFMLMISDKGQSKAISNMPCNFTVFVGYCDGMNSIVNGSGLNDSGAGEVSRFSVVLRDAYQYPAPVELETLQVQIIRDLDSYHIQPSIFPMPTENATVTDNWSTSDLEVSSVNHMETASAPTVEPVNNSTEHGKVRASSFDVIYTPEKSGIYAITVFCGNIPLNGGHPFKKEVSAGEVSISLSGVVKFEPKAPKMIRNEIVVQLMDSFSNPVLSQQSKLELEIASINKSGFSTWMFVNDNYGLYTGYYLAKDVGSYEICASFNSKHFLPCPFGVNVYTSDYFPKAYDDSVSVWEDESITFDALQNDYLAGGNANIVEFSQPGHGSLLQYEQLFLYTPYKGFAGNDSFSYTISDVNSNLASGAVNISIISIPPQFISVPNQLHAIEDLISPRFGGFLGIEILYSDLKENISVSLVARTGTVLLSPMLMQFWQPMWSELSVSKGDGNAKELKIEGRLEVINFALQSIQYLGNENFCGDDMIQVSTMNENGVNHVDVPIFVEPMNDSPFINVPKLVVLGEKNDEEGLLIFDRQTNKFDFSIGDPDLINFPGNDSHFLVMFSVEVSSGFLSTKLPAELISTTELKLKNSHQWQALQTFVTISKHFMVKARGIRFQGSVNDCNSIMEQLLYHGEEFGAILILKVNDMGNYGCYSDCAEKTTSPLFTEAYVNLVRRRPMTSLVAHTLGSAIAIESVLVFSLGVLLLYFTCKCAIVLVHEKRRRAPRDIELSEVQSSSKRTSSIDFSENVADFSGWCPSPLFMSQPSNIRQRSFRHSGMGESSKSTHHSSQSSKIRIQLHEETSA
ncbi:protein GAMETE EXPRESSED 2 [Rhododendron vialii]|uniref:protein GAMETE EXPRESSED 2 n=1 Tax=Rhododendron vialii TaxID=182163 RepID=UPI00265EA428|nr:protein GAMETE EXPRESSED 2 [Rhododendron vialii]